MNGGIFFYSFKEGTIFVFQNEPNIQIYSMSFFTLATNR